MIPLPKEYQYQARREVQGDGAHHDPANDLDGAPATVFSRTGFTSPLGKCDDMIDGFRVESIAKEAFERKVAATGKPRAEFLRNIVHIVAFGLDEARRMHGDGVVVVWKTIGGMPNDT